MDSQAIISKIHEIRKPYGLMKTSGREYMAVLAQEFNNFNIYDRADVIQFFLNEIQFNYKGMRDFALDVLQAMDVRDAASKIYAIYLSTLISDKEEWEERIVDTLMSLRFNGANKLYSDFISKRLKIEDRGSNFFLFVLYCRVNPKKAINLLSDYFCKNLESEVNNKEAFFKNRMGSLFYDFQKNPEDYTKELLTQTSKRSRIVARKVKDIMIYYLNSDLGQAYGKEFTQKRINLLNSLNI
jgi:hypothetical protein